MNISRYTHHQCLCLYTEPQPRPASPGPLQDQQVGLAQAPMKSRLLPWVPGHTRPCVCPSRVKSVFWSPVEYLWSSPAGLRSSKLWGFLFPMPVLQDRKPDIELRILTPVGELLRYNNSLVCGLPTHGVWDWLIILQVYPSYHLIGFLLYVFGCRISSLIGSSLFSLVVVQQLVVMWVFS